MHATVRLAQCGHTELGFEVSFTLPIIERAQLSLEVLRGSKF